MKSERLARLILGALTLASLAAPSFAGGEANQAIDSRLGNILQDHTGDIVLITSKTGVGSGFIYTRAGRRFLVSNIHVLAGVRQPVFTPLDHSTLKFKPGPAVAAVGHDIIMMELEPGTNGISLVEDFGKTVKVNDPVGVYGNTSGQNVATAMKGTLLGIGADRIEIDAAFELGNSGSPIIHLPSGKVIGVTTYAIKDNLLSGDKKIRRFGFRMDTVKQWETVDWGLFYADAERIKKVVDETAELRQAHVELATANQRDAKTRLYTYETPAIRDSLDVFYTAFRTAKTPPDIERAAGKLLTSLKNASQTDSTSIKPTFTYDYFRRRFAEEEAYRTEIMKYIAKMLTK